MFAEVAVDAPVARPGGVGRETFTYLIPPELELQPGHMVWVPFGPRTVVGVVVALVEEAPAVALRLIHSLMSPEPALSPHQIALARWLGDYYREPLFAALSPMLSPGLSHRMVTFLEPGPQAEARADLTPEQRQFLAYLSQRGRVKQDEVRRRLGRKEAEAVMEPLVRRGLVRRSYEPAPPRARPKLAPWVRLASPETAGAAAAQLAVSSRTLPQARMLQFLQEQGGATSKAALRERLGSFSGLAPLIKRGLVVMETVEVRRDPLAHRPVIRTQPPTLMPAQAAALGAIEEALREGRSDVFLLHGVTGSGKTEVYLGALAQAVAQGKRGIVLVPEIALTPQTIDRFAGRFPGRVAVLHSRLSPGELFDEWRRIAQGAFDVVIGSRSAIFAPQPNLGLIVLDEEHEWTYKQHDQSPRYHAREVALKLAELCGATVILGSATPAVTTYYRAQRGEIGLLTLPERIAMPGAGNGTGAPGSLPQVEVVDMRQELRRGGRSLFSRSLIGAMAQALDNREQVILFLNRRGTATLVQCRACAEVVKCRRCQVALTYHATEDVLICHQCNQRYARPLACPQCGGELQFLGAGTQRVEAELGRFFPEARLLRWDRDATLGRRAHETILDRFIAHQADILIGTQMVAKGLELPLVSLVGIVNADVGLYLPDLAAAERTFQLLTQVAGRAGRGQAPGRVVLQTYSPEHYAIQAAARQDYAEFYEQEIAFRRRLGDPPFGRLICLLHAATNLAACQKESERVGRLLRQEREARGLVEIEVLGPAPAYQQRLRGRYRWQLLLRGRQPERLLAEMTLPQGWTVDVDPVSLL